MSETHRITVDPGQCGGRPCLRGLRIRVRDVLDLLAAGADRAEILADYPLLEAGDITAALEYAHDNIRVNAVCPGWIRTDAAMESLRAMARTQQRTEAEVEREILSGQALPGMLAPADIAGVYLFLASEDARCMTGQSLVASNGEVMA